MTTVSMTGLTPTQMKRIARILRNLAMILPDDVWHRSQRSEYFGLSNALLDFAFKRWQEAYDDITTSKTGGDNPAGFGNEPATKGLP